MVSFATIYRAELLKTKHTFAAWLTIIGAGFVPTIMLIAYLVKPAHFVLKNSTGNAWDQLFGYNFAIVSGLFLPIYVVLIAGLLLNFEHRSNTWKHIFVQPASKGKIFFSKVTVMLQMIVACYLLFIFFQLLFGVIIGLAKPQLSFFDAAPHWGTLFKVTLRSFVATLAIFSIHFWISFRLKNIIVPIAVGLLGVILGGVLIARWEHVDLYPYAYTSLTVMPKYAGGFFADYHWIGLGYFAVIGTLSYFDFTKYFRG